MADAVIEEVKRRLDIIDLISQSVPLKRAGRYFKGLCPFHQEKTPSFVVYPEQGTFHCFGCSKTGDVFTWVQETEHLDFGEALRRLAARAGVRLPDRSPQPADAATRAPAEALAAAAAWYQRQLLQAADAEPARRYLGQRGLKPETIERFGIGWAPGSRDALGGYLRARGFSPPQLEAAGLVLSGDGGLRDRFRGRVLFPIRDAAGQVVGFGGRVLGEGQPKYLNSPQTALFDKSATLYALDLAKPAIRKAGCAVIVEGYLDAVLPHQEGFSNVVASLGTALTERQIELLKPYAAAFVLALDADAAGQAATLRGLEVARQALAAKRRPVPGPATRTGYLQLAAGQLKIAVLKGGKDPDEIVREDPEAWRRLVAGAVPMMEHKLAVELARVDPQDAQSKLAAVQELARFLVQVPDRIEWAHYVDRIAQRLRIDVHAVRDEVARASRSIRDAQDRRGGERAAGGRAGAGSAAEAPGPALAREAPGPAETSPSAARAAGAPPVGEGVTEEHLVSLLVLAPHLVRRLPARLVPEDFRRPECRELYRTVVAFVEGQPAPSPAGPAGGAPLAAAPAAADDPFRPIVDVALRDYYDAVVERARQRPRQTESQLEADVAGVVRRIRERNLRGQLLEAQYLLAEANADDERLVLARQVERLAAQLGRVQLERSRASLYTSPAS